jgi:hypothetical protein
MTNLNSQMAKPIQNRPQISGCWIKKFARFGHQWYNRNMTREASIILGLCTCMTANGAETREAQLAPAPVKMGVESPEVWYRNLPLWVLVSLTNSSAQELEIPEMDCWAIFTPVTLVARAANGQEVAGDVPADAFFSPGPHTASRQAYIPKKKWTLAPEEVRDFTLNLGWALERLGPISGPREVRLRLWSPARKVIAESGPVSVLMADLPEDTLKPVLAKTKVTTAGLVNYLAVTLGDLRQVDNPEIRSALVFSLFLRQLSAKNETESVPVAEYERELPSRLLPQAREIQYEILLSSGEKSRAEALRESVLRQNPGMRYWFKASEAGEGTLKRGR